jgi:PEP-CTERM motif
MKKTLLAAIALTGAAVLGNANAANGDLYLGFEATGGIGQTANLVFDLGSAANFNSISGNIGADLAATYGDNWYSRSDLFYGAVGAVNPSLSGDPINTLYGTDNSGAGAWNRASAAAQGTVVSKIRSMQTQIGTDLANGQGGLTSGVVIMNNSELAAWGAYTTIGGTSFGSFNGSIEGSVGSVLDLYRMAPGVGQGGYIGSLTIGQDGSVAAVPEPATYTLMGLGALILIVAYRRKTA